MLAFLLCSSSSLPFRRRLPPSLDFERAAFFVFLVALGTSRSNDDDDENNYNNTAKKTTTTRKKTSSESSSLIACVLRIVFALSELINASSFIMWIMHFPGGEITSLLLS